MQFFPTVDLKQYNKSDFTYDLLAGLTSSVMVVPQGMAYAMLAGLPAIYGLYAALICLVVYPILGTSVNLMVGPVALVAIISFNAVSHLYPSNTDGFITTMMLLGLLAGLIQLIFGIARLGMIANFLSKPVIQGFTGAAAIIIALSQIKYAIGVDINRAPTFLQNLINTIQSLPKTHWQSLAITSVCIAIIMLIRKWKKLFPAGLLVVIISIILSYNFHWDEYGVAVVGTVPSGFPSLSIPPISYEIIIKLLPSAFVVAIISFIECMAISRSLSTPEQAQKLKPNSELIILGISKILGSMFHGFPSSGSFTRSAVNQQAGARTALSSLIGSVLIAMVLLFMAPVFTYLPKAVLASIVLVSAIGMLNFKHEFRLFNLDRHDFYAFIFTFIATLILGIQQGVFVGITVSLLMLIWKLSKPNHAILGELPENKGVYKNRDRFDDVTEDSDILIFRFDGDLNFANIDHFIKSLTDVTSEKKNLKLIIMDFSSISNIDSTAIEQLIFIKKLLAKSSIELYISGMKGEVRDLFHKYQLDSTFPVENRFFNIHQAVSHYRELTS